MTQNTTLDGLLDRRVMIEQPETGYRVAIDTVLLAAAVPITAGGRALDLGCGVGGAMLCLAKRVADISATGIEIDGELAELCAANITRNGFKDRLHIVRGDVLHLSSEWPILFDHALMNPPYHDEAQHDVSAHAQKRRANSEKSGELARWIAVAASALKTMGTLTMINRADRISEIFDLLRPTFGAIEILPLLPKEEGVAKRALFRARKDAPNAAQTPTECYGKKFVLHQADGSYTESAEAVLRHMKPLEFGAR